MSAHEDNAEGAAMDATEAPDGNGTGAVSASEGPLPLASPAMADSYTPEQREKAAEEAMKRGMAPVKLEYLQPRAPKPVERVAVTTGGEAFNKSKKQQRKVRHTHHHDLARLSCKLLLGLLTSNRDGMFFSSDFGVLAVVDGCREPINNAAALPHPDLFVSCPQDFKDAKLLELCHSFVQNKCIHGEKCKFSHDAAAYARQKQPDVPGQCPFASLERCPYGGEAMQKPCSRHITH